MIKAWKLKISENNLAYKKLKKIWLHYENQISFCVIIQLRKEDHQMN